VLGRTEKGYEQGVSVRALLKANNIETLRQYQHRARAALNMQRQACRGAWARGTFGQLRRLALRI
jgi:hypothetical protein